MHGLGKGLNTNQSSDDGCERPQSVRLFCRHKRGDG
jgi:hypothetical protein